MNDKIIVKVGHSANIKKIVWKSKNQELDITFKNNRKYRYFNFTIYDFCDLIVDAHEIMSWNDSFRKYIKQFQYTEIY